jgi:TfoX/Sxy family transcriptional regulator of competence genes
MAFDDDLATRVRDLLAARDGVTERKMFGGIAWLINGNMACGVLNDDLIVRLEREESERALNEPHTRAFDVNGRPMAGFLFVAPDGIEAPEALARWVDAGANHAASLEPK